MLATLCAANGLAPQAAARKTSAGGPGFLRAPSARRQLSVVARSAGPGGNVLDRPGVAPGQDQRRERKRRRPPSYRVMLHNDNFNRREYVVQVLLKVVGITVDDAVNIMQEAHINGLAMVTQTSQDQAEQYCEGLRLAGLISTIEPAGGGAGSGADAS